MSLFFKTATMSALLCLVRIPQKCCTDGDPRESSFYMLIWMPEPVGLCSVCSILRLQRLCTKLLHQFFLEENIHINLLIYFLTAGLRKRLSNVYHPCSSILGQYRVIVDAGTH